MDQITARTLRAVEWKPVYVYTSAPGAFGKPNYSFTTYASSQLPGLTITKEERTGRRFKTITTYKFMGRKTDSPTQIVRYWNEHAKKAKGLGGRLPAGSPKSAGPT
jgi:hypothetical protein